MSKSELSCKAMTKRQTVLIAFAVVLIAGLLPFGVLIAAAIYGHRAAERTANEAATIQNLKTIAAVETQYFNSHDRTYATIEQLVRERMLSEKFAAVPLQVDGYSLTLKLTNPTAYTLTADPVDRSSGRRHFYFDSASMQIRVNPDGPAGPDDPIQ
jgi:hypothetical protein